jgi:dihydrolipoamide dehydrogenase
MVGTHANGMIAEIEMGTDTVEIGRSTYPNSTLGESIGMVAEVVYGSCTDVPPARR